MSSAEKSLGKSRSFYDYLKLSFVGFAMGVANVIPGVSGGTIAFISGIYEELISSIRAFASVSTIKKVLTLKVKELYLEMPWAFLLAIAVGTLFAFATVAKLVTWLLVEHESFTFAAFLGMIAGSILTVLKMVKKWDYTCFAALLIGTVVAYFIVTMIPCETPNLWWISFLSGIVVIIAMILPGISGSFLLLVMGQYKYVWGAISDMSRLNFSIEAFLTCFWMGLGSAIGLGAFSHCLNWLFKRWHDVTVSTLIGFMVGSMWRLWPWQETVVFSAKLGKEVRRISIPPATTETIEQIRNSGAKITPLVQKNLIPQNFDASFFFVVILFIVGFACVMLMEYYANKNDKTAKE
ncbi:MAG TPA: DUF368 domain-containing protein [Victivallales bacterium]|nr:DUF368 domain-containing protein [Victivallales bacterium]